ncbi:MAG TPA: FHA domain-containing protein, partial [Pyrinomonadaceae bacterium]|nr:FHA domain-containing protein [Pyrinomonadaceae bacterium]
MEVVLICSTSEGSEEIRLQDNSQISFGRSSEADHRLADDGLSRLHSTVFREGDNIWVIDENSTNGTFVNGEKVLSGGTPLHNADRIKIGNYTDIKVKFVQPEKPQTQTVGKSTQTISASKSSPTISLSALLPIAIISFGLLLIAGSALFIGYVIISRNSEPP